MSVARRWVMAGALGSGVAGLAYWRRSLTPDGALAAAGVGTVVFATGGLAPALALLTFFVSSSGLSAFKTAAKTAQAKGSRRDAWQVLANGGAATAYLAVGVPHGFLGALAAAGADTWATELGMLARQPPRLITTLRTVRPGTSGGITVQGLLASLAGAAVVGLGWRVGGGSLRGVRVTLIAGVTGALVDSLLGATVQAVYVCATCRAELEAPRHPGCGQPARRVRGWAGVNNDVVNALATLAGAAFGARL
jgi:uncharacterized protein (TIGR00297 family)